MATSNIEWTDETWNPVVGCKKVSAGCKHCYAEAMAARHVLMSAAQGRQSPYLPVVDAERRRWNGRAVTVPERLADPLGWQKSRRVFVNSMSDLFHEDVPLEFIAAVFGVMAACSRHTFQVLTKRPARMLEFLHQQERVFGAPTLPTSLINEALFHMEQDGARDSAIESMGSRLEAAPPPWPLPNVWLGVSVEDQATADERIPLLQQAPAAIRFISAEPLLGPINLSPDTCPDCDGHDARIEMIDEKTCSQPWCTECDSEMGDPGWLDPEGIDWVIVGGESGLNARPMQEEWARSIRDQCAEQGVPFFFKQWGGVNKKKAGRILDGRTHDDFPEVRHD